MRRSITTAMMTGLVLLAPCLVSGEPSSEVAFDAPTRALLAAADPASGEKLAEKCDKCHGDAGVSEDPVRCEYCRTAGLVYLQAAAGLPRREPH